MDARACTLGTEHAIIDLGAAFMLDAATTARGEEFGLDFGGFYGLGRGGVLGDVDADVVASAFVFFNPSMVRIIWELARTKHEPTAAAAAYAEACDAWGRERIADADGLAELDTLLGRVVAAASPIGAPLFAGWRAVPLADDPPARVMRQVHVLRELRGGLHGVAVLAAGLSPHEAMVASGSTMIALFGWAEPHPDREPLLAAHAAALDTTTRLVAPSFEVLDDGERDRLVELLDGVSAAAGI